MVKMYTDGACLGNPGPGGWGVLLMLEGNERELSGNEEQTTNNRMELTAVIKGLGVLKRSTKITVYTDSQYVKNGITVWINKWRKQNWLKSDKKPVKNKDLWLELEAVVALHTVEWQWVKAHSGVVENERVDQLAYNAAKAINA